MSVAGAINAVRASYWARAISTGSVWVAGTPLPLSSKAWIWGSTGIAIAFYSAVDDQISCLHEIKIA
jgi:hypothetical protein